ncbi:MAG TPA: D-alanyl-D-alanine carboxypeptidase family protein, partial [Beijerinckiaceae bacterium]|nr:D-alanyl-D-alanine carboxypeptidase family protein [Beijerinckiaceae bacterium]
MMGRILGLAVLAAAMVMPAALRAAPELVVDVSSGQVIHAEEATRPWFPASTTKMMTAYVALRAMKAGQISLDTPLIASARAAGQPPSKIGLRPGQEITLDNALKVLMVKSANDVAVVIAEGVAGSLDGFSRLMNEEAARLGMRHSHFVNPHGLHSASHVSSARDLAILGRALLVEFPQFRDYWGIGAVKLGARVMRNTNGLIGRYPGAEGMKTGFVCASGFNVVALANRGGRTMLAVVLGSGSGAERTIRTAQLLDKGFSSWGGGYGALTGLAESGYGSAPNMRQEICRRGRQIFLGEEEDSGGAIMMPTMDSGSVFAVMMPQATAARSVGSIGSGGRPSLGPRADLIPIEVTLGRTPGSTEVARGP